MRTSGVTDVVVGMNPNDRLCRPVDGLAQGQRVRYVARGDDRATHLESEPVPAQALRDGRAEMVGLESRYRTSSTVTPEAQVEACAEATRDPLRVDATGLRFIDHHGLLALHGCARSNAATLVLCSQRSSLPRLVTILELKDVECVR